MTREVLRVTCVSDGRGCSADHFIEGLVGQRASYYVMHASGAIDACDVRMRSKIVLGSSIWIPNGMRSLDRPYLVVLGREAHVASECGATSSQRVDKIDGKLRLGMARVSALMNQKIGSATKAGSIGCMTKRRGKIRSRFAFKARGRVVVGILDKEQEAAHRCGVSTSTTPRRNCVTSERVACSGAHDNQRRTLPCSVSKQARKPEESSAPDCRSDDGMTRCCGRPCSTYTAGGSVCLAA